MDVTIRMEGLGKFLTTIYGEKTDLGSMLDSLGFDQEQCRRLNEMLPEIGEQFIQALRARLSFGDKDLWFRLLSRVFGLDGEPPAAVEQAAMSIGVAPGYASQTYGDALQKCRYKRTQTELRKDLHRIALAELTKGGAAPAKDVVAGKLTRLADLQSARDVVRMDYEAKRDEILKKVQAELDALESEYQPLLDAADFNADTLEAEIKNDVLLAGESVTTDFYQAYYMKGRITWDTDGMARYANSHPDVLRFRKEGQPYVTLRKGTK